MNRQLQHDAERAAKALFEEIDRLERIWKHDRHAFNAAMEPYKKELYRIHAMFVTRNHKNKNGENNE